MKILQKQDLQVEKFRELPLRLGFDVPLLLVTITLVVTGLVMVYSASYGISYYVAEDQSPSYMFTRQVLWLGVGLVLMVLTTFFNYHHWRKLALPAMIITILALLGVLLFGQPVGDTARAFSEGSYQPSELAKLMIIIYLAVWMNSKQEILGDVKFGLIPLALILGLVGGLIFSQPDISAAATIIFLGAIIFFIAGGDWWQIVLLVLGAMLIGYLVINFNQTGSERMTSFLEGLKDPLASSEHVQRALYAFANGGWTGVGLGNGTIKLTILPVPHTDSIFAVIGEELGVMGCTLVIILFGLFLWRGLVIANSAPDGLGALLAAGIAFWIALEGFFNMLAVTGLMPFAGNVLPFFSLGGSSLVFTLVGVGILFNISRMSEKVKLEEERRRFDAFIDLRGRNRGGRVSRSRRSRPAKK